MGEIATLGEVADSALPLENVKRLAGREKSLEIEGLEEPIESSRREKKFETKDPNESGKGEAHRRKQWGLGTY